MHNDQLTFNQLPVIGIVAHRIQRDGNAGHIDGQYGDYSRSVALAGGAPILIPLALGEPAWRAIYARLDGILFPGGVDVAPALYGETPHPRLGRVDDVLDEAELTLARWALADGMPTLAICRGIQLINVAAGGTLYQDISSQIDGALLHACSDQPAAHLVRIEAGTRLYNALGAAECVTNSRHHQSIKQVAPDLAITARAPDGVIEGVEHPTGPFLVGVQWHPENLAPNDEQMLGLFRAFVEACQHTDTASR